MDTLLKDLRYATRMLFRNPGFAALAVITLALGLGANTAIFSVVNAILLRPLPYAQPQNLVVALHNGNAPVSPADFLDYRREVTAFEQIAAAQGWSGSVQGAQGSEIIQGLRISSNMIQLLGVAPLLGRSFNADEERPGASQVLLLSYALWNRFGGDPAIIGKKLTLDNAPFTVIGVMPKTFQFSPFWLTRAEMWTPLDLSSRVNDRDGRSLRVFARLKPQVSLSQAQSQMDAVAKRLAERFPNTNAKLGIKVIPLHEKVVGAVRPTLFVLLGTVGFVLLIACTNVANLLLMRAISRRKEIALRIAIGASRGRLIRQLLTESLLLAGVAAAVGLAIAQWGLALLTRILPLASMPRQQELGLDHTAFLFAFALSVLTGLVSGLAPALQLSRSRLSEDLKEGGRNSTHGSSRHRLNKVLVAAEVALALVLLSGAGLMVRTMIALQSVDAGFNPKSLLTMVVSIAGTARDNPTDRAHLYDQVLRALAALPGVESASAINHLPIGGDIWMLGFQIEGRPEPAPGERPSAVYRVAMPGYFETMKLRLIRGRDFTIRDGASAPLVAVINETMARRRWPGQDPIGKRIVFGALDDHGRGLQTIIGVVKDARQSDWTSPPEDEVYLPYLQRPGALGLGYLTFVVRTHTDPEILMRPVQVKVWGIDGRLGIAEVSTMEHVIADKLWRSRLSTILLGMFASIALVLAAVGIYGVISYSVRGRTNEIGIRLALGAKQSDVIRLALVEGMVPVLAGAGIGFAMALLVTRFMKSLLFDVSATDPSTMLIVTVLLILIAGSANYVPARQAARIDPLAAIRQD